MQGSANDTHPHGRSQDGCKELCNVQLSIVEHVKQRTWLLKKVGALSRSVIFVGSTAKLLEALASLERLNQRRLVRDKVWAPSKIIIFDGAQIYTVLT
jgi:hypothetical protein